MADKPAIQAAVTVHLRVNVDEVECKTAAATTGSIARRGPRSENAMRPLVAPVPS
jgi:hypothetical protein